MNDDTPLYTFGHGGPAKRIIDGDKREALISAINAQTAAILRQCDIMEQDCKLKYGDKWIPYSCTK